VVPLVVPFDANVWSIVSLCPANSQAGRPDEIDRIEAVLSPDEARRLVDSIGVTKHAALRDRAMIGLMVYSFARIGAALGIKVEDVFVQDRQSRCSRRPEGGGLPPSGAGARLAPLRDQDFILGHY
jgi:integrase